MELSQTEIGLIHMIPLEIQYLIFDRLNPVDVVRTVKAIGVLVDDLYWSRRHKSKFARVLKEIESIKYSIQLGSWDNYAESESTLIVRGYTTTYSYRGIVKIDSCLQFEGLESESNKPMNELPSNYSKMGFRTTYCNFLDESTMMIKRELYLAFNERRKLLGSYIYDYSPELRR